MNGYEYGHMNEPPSKGVFLRFAFKHTCLIILSGMLVSSCCTPALWDATDPCAYVQVAQGQVTDEELRGKGLKFYRDDAMGVFYVQKSGVRKLGDYMIRAVAIPVTVVVDAVTTIVVVGVLVNAKSYQDQQQENPDAYIQVYP